MYAFVGHLATSIQRLWFCQSHVYLLLHVKSRLNFDCEKKIPKMSPLTYNHLINKAKPIDQIRDGGRFCVIE